VLALAGTARPLMALRAWPVFALAVGLGPLALGYTLGMPLHHLLMALLLGPLFWACVCEDRLGKALLLVALVVGSHSALAIGLAAFDPAGAARVLPQADDYWQQTLHWVRTGEDAHYEPVNWLPDHLLLLFGLLAASYTSLGLLPFTRGVQQLDLMNYYVGRLMASSQNPAVALAAGWHPWSFLRGLGYTLLIYEVASLSLERFSGQTLSTPRRRWLRWAVGLGCCFGDALLKFALRDLIRSTLLSNLLPVAED
jgi:hypothetical protein